MTDSNEKRNPDNEPDTSLTFDKQLFGLLIRRARINRGYKSVDEFLLDMEQKLKYKGISRDVMYRIESGKTEPSISQMMAINAMIDCSLLDGVEFKRNIELCTPNFWNTYCAMNLPF